MVIENSKTKPMNFIFLKSIMVEVLTVFLLIMPTKVKTQQPNIQWQKCLGGIEFQSGVKIIQSTDGGIVLAGTSISSTPLTSMCDTVTGLRDQDAWVVKLGSSGNILWKACMGGGYDEGFFSIIQTNDNGFICIGYKSERYNGSDIWIVKLSNTGNIQWERTFGGSSNEVSYSIIQTSDGGYAFAGSSISHDGLLSGNPYFSSFNSNGSFNYWVVKLSSIGNIEWRSILGGTSRDDAGTIIQTSDGGYMIGGNTRSKDGNVTGSFGTNNSSNPLSNNSDIWLIKLDALGNIVWNKCYGGNSYDYYYGMIKTVDDGFVIYCNAQGGGNLNSNTNVFKINSSGNVMWQRNLASAYYSPRPNTIANTFDDGFVITYADTSSLGNYMLAKFDSDGNKIWMNSFGGSKADFPFSVVQTSDFGYAIVGITYSNDGDVSGNQISDTTIYSEPDYWVVKLSAPIGIEESQRYISNMHIYPNPTNNILHITCTEPIAYIEIYNLLGELVQTKIGEINTLMVNELAQGIYTIKLQTNQGKMAVSRFVKQ